MKKYTLLAVLFLLILYPLSIWAQSDVIISPVVNPPYSPYVADYQNLQKGLITITNTTNKTLNIKLIGSIEGNGFYFRTKKNYTPFKALTLTPKQVKTFFGNTQETDFFGKNNTETNVSTQQFQATMTSGIIPEGTYKLCVQAFDFNTNQPLSMADPVGCFTFNISYPQPPVITCMPIIHSPNPTFTWTPPAGFVAGAQLRYDFLLVNLTKLGNVLPPDEIINQAIAYNAGNPFRVNDLAVTNYNYGPMNPPLEKGSKYVMVVVAKDKNNKIVFQNKGRSEICIFNYGMTPVPQSNPTPVAQSNSTPPPPANCSCKKMLIDKTAVTTPSVAVNTKLKIGAHEVTLTEVTTKADATGKFSANGVIPIPILKSKYVKVRVQLTNVKINSKNEIIEGRVSAKRKAGAVPSLIPNYDNPNFDGLSLTPGQMTDLSNFFSTTKEQVISAASNSANSLGFEMPLGIEKLGQTIAITGMEFTPEQSYLDALVVIDLLGENQQVALGGRSICFDADKFCGDARLFLAKDFESPSFSGAKLTLKGQGSNNQELNSYVDFDGDGFKNFRAKMEFTFPSSVIKSAANPALPAKATMTADVKSWDKWIGNVTFDPFTIAGISDFVFKPKDGFYDHDISKNPDGLPTNLYESLASELWEGFLIKNVDIELPGFFNQNNQKTVIGTKDLIIDDNGVSTNILAQNIISFGNAKLGGWNYSLDKIQVEILKNAFKQGSLDGKIALPIADTKLDYKCILSYANSSAQYQFTIKPKDDIDVPLFLAKFTLNETSNFTMTNVGGSFEAKAELDGKMSISTTVPALNVPVKFDAMSFQDMVISSNAPYFNVGQFTMGYASPDKDFSGFSYSIQKTEFVTDNGKIGLKFGGQIGLADLGGVGIKAGSELIFWGKFVNGKPAFDQLEVVKIALKTDFSVFRLEGIIDFYKKDITYGTGFRGGIKAKIKPLDFDIEVNLQMGKTLPEYAKGGAFKYWYFDALAFVPSGAAPQLFPGVEAFGFGGGAYYKMKLDGLPKTITSSNTNLPNIGGSRSGAKYVPDASISLGIKATVYLGLSARTTFNADATLDIAFDNSFGLSTVNVNGNARVLSNENYTDGLIKGSVNIFYDHVQGIFKANVDASMKVPPSVNAYGTLAIYFAKGGNWHLKFGTPNDPLTLNFAGFDALKSYFEVGNYDIDAMPDPDANILAILQKSGVNWKSQRPEFNPNALQVIHGSKTGFHYNGEFLIFYADLFAGAGYDLGLGKVATGCDGKAESAESIGFKGYYGLGQMYAGVSASIGIEVDLWLVSGKYEIISAGIGAVLEAGVANPLWCHGAVGGYYSILDGLVEGNCSFEFSVGQACLPGTGDPLSNIKLISDISPKPDENGKNNKPQDLVMSLGAATNLKMASYKEIKIEERAAGQAQGRMRIFRFHEGLIKASLTGGSKPITLKTKADLYGFGMTYTPVDNAGNVVTLDKKTNYYFNVKANLEECLNVVKSGDNYYSCGGNWELGKKDGKVFEEAKSVKFTTGDGFERIAESNVKSLFPYKNHRYFCYQDMPMGIGLNYIFNKNSYKILPSGLNENDYNIKYFVRAVPLSNIGKTLSSDINPDGQQYIPFKFNSNFDKNTIYRLQIGAKWLKKGNVSGNNTETGITKINAIDAVNSSTTKVNNWNSDTRTPNWTKNMGHVYARINARELIASKLEPADNEKILYDYSFRTSNYQNLADKLKQLTIQQAEYTARPIVQMLILSAAKATLDKSELKNAATIDKALRDKFTKAANDAKGKGAVSIWVPKPNEPMPVYISEMDFNAYERFDDIDVDKKLVTFSSVQYSKMYQDLYQKIFTILVGQNKFKNVDIIEEMSFGEESSQTGKITYKEAWAEWVDFMTDPVLSEDEVKSAIEMSKSSSQTQQNNSGGNGFNVDMGKLATYQNNTGGKFDVSLFKKIQTSTTNSGGGLMTEENRIFGAIYTKTKWLGYPVDMNANNDGNIWSGMGVAYDATVGAMGNFTEGVPDVQGNFQGGFDAGGKVNGKGVGAKVGN